MVSILQSIKERLRPVERQYLNPLEKRVGDGILVNGQSFTVETIREVNREIAGEKHVIVDYGLGSVTIRYYPQDDIILRLEPLAEFEYEEQFHKGVLLGLKYRDYEDDWVKDENYNLEFQDGEDENLYYRVNDVKLPYPCTVHIIEDINGSGHATSDEIKVSRMTLWDYWRQVDKRMPVEYIFVEMDDNTGYFTLTSGEEINISDVI